MKKIAHIIIASTMLFVPTLGHAEGCADIAASLAEQVSGEVVGVESLEQSCRVKIRIPGKNGQPSRVETKTVNK